MIDKLKEIIISVTNRCNLRCRMCQIPKMHHNEEMHTEQLKELIRDSAKLYPESIVFSGGEPLLRGDLFDLITLANQCKINTCLTSNGTLINDEAAKRLASCGIGVVNISIEGPEDTHDFLRGKGAFAKAVNALECLSRHKVETTIATVVCRQNYKFLPFIMDLTRKFGATTVKFQPFNELFLAKKEEKSGFFLPHSAFKELKSNIEEVIRLSEEYKIAVNPSNYLYAISAYLCGFYKENYRKDCLAISRSCPISAEGNVYLCWVLSDMLLGNIKETELSKIWNSDEHNRLRQIVMEKGCSGCLMSCYDYNFGKYAASQPIYYKVKRMNESKFYKRKYYQYYQYLKYISGKVSNRIINLNIFRKEYNKCNDIQALEEIKIAKNMLLSRLKSLERDEKG